LFLSSLENFDGGDGDYSMLDEWVKLCEQGFYMFSGVDHFYDERETIGGIDEALCGEVMLWAKAFDPALHGGSQYAMLSGKVEESL
jgi:hypothetical protein